MYAKKKIRSSISPSSLVKGVYTVDLFDENLIYGIRGTGDLVPVASSTIEANQHCQDRETVLRINLIDILL